MSTTYIKENGVTRVSEEEIKKEQTKSLQINRMPIFNFYDGKYVPLKDKSCRIVTSYLDSIANKGYKKSFDLLTVLTYRIITVSSEEDLLSTDANSLYSLLDKGIRKALIIPSKPSGFYSRNNKYYDLELQRDLSVLVTVSKDIIKRYVRAYMEKYTEAQLIEIDKKIKNGESPLEFIDVNDVKLSLIEDESLKQFVCNMFDYYMTAKIQEVNGGKHLCMDCGCELMECPKIRDINKRNIAEYDFITDGIQKTHMVSYSDPDYPGEPPVDIETVDEFIVTKCKKHVRTYKTPRNGKYYVVKK